MNKKLITSFSSISESISDDEFFCDLLPFATRFFIFTDIGMTCKLVACLAESLKCHSFAESFPQSLDELLSTMIEYSAYTDNTRLIDAFASLVDELDGDKREAIVMFFFSLLERDELSVEFSLLMLASIYDRLSDEQKQTFIEAVESNAKSECPYIRKSSYNAASMIKHSLDFDFQAEEDPFVQVSMLKCISTPLPVDFIINSCSWNVQIAYIRRFKDPSGFIDKSESPYVLIEALKHYDDVSENITRVLSENTDLISDELIDYFCRVADNTEFIEILLDKGCIPCAKACLSYGKSLIKKSAEILGASVNWEDRLFLINHISKNIDILGEFLLQLLDDKACLVRFSCVPILADYALTMGPRWVRNRLVTRCNTMLLNSDYRFKMTVCQLIGNLALRCPPQFIDTNFFPITNAILHNIKPPVKQYYDDIMKQILSHQ